MDRTLLATFSSSRQCSLAGIQVFVLLCLCTAATNIVALRLPHEVFWVSQAKVHGVARLLFSVMTRDTENIE
jgi:hypothetical protein